MWLSTPSGISLPKPPEVAQFFSRVALVQGVYQVSAPANYLQLFGFPATPLSKWMAECNGHGWISLFVFLHCLLDSGNLREATAYSVLPWVLWNGKAIGSDRATKLGAKKQGFGLSIVLDLGILYTVFSGQQDWASPLIQFHVLLGILQGVFFSLYPRQMVRARGDELVLSDTVVAQMKTFGAYCLAHAGATAWLMFTDATVAQATGWMIVCFLVHGVDTLFLSKDCEKIGVAHKGPIYGLAAFIAVLAYLMLRP